LTADIRAASCVVQEAISNIVSELAASIGVLHAHLQICLREGLLSARPSFGGDAPGHLADALGVDQQELCLVREPCETSTR
jgi:hypothetical protein